MPVHLLLIMSPPCRRFLLFLRVVIARVASADRSAASTAGLSLFRILGLFCFSARNLVAHVFLSTSDLFPSQTQRTLTSSSKGFSSADHVLKPFRNGLIPNCERERELKAFPFICLSISGMYWKEKKRRKPPRASNALLRTKNPFPASLLGAWLRSYAHRANQRSEKNALLPQISPLSPPHP